MLLIKLLLDQLYFSVRRSGRLHSTSCVNYMVQYLLEFPHIPSHVLTLLASASEKWWNGGKNRNNPFILKFPGFRDIIKTLAFIQSGTGTQRRSKRDLSGSSVQNKLKARLAWKQGVWWRGCLPQVISGGIWTRETAVERVKCSLFCIYFRIVTY